jgi:acyl carrier protein
MDIKKTLREFLLNELRDNGFHEGIKDDESLNNSGIMDSLGILIVISFLQDKFDIILDTNDLNADDFDSVNAICNLVKKKYEK